MERAIGHVGAKATVLLELPRVQVGTVPVLPGQFNDGMELPGSFYGAPDLRLRKSIMSEWKFVRLPRSPAEEGS